MVIMNYILTTRLCNNCQHVMKFTHIYFPYVRNHHKNLSKLSIEINPRPMHKSPPRVLELGETRKEKKLASQMEWNRRKNSGRSLPNEDFKLGEEKRVGHVTDKDIIANSAKDEGRQSKLN